MHKFWLIAKQEFRLRTFKRSFILGTMIVPFMMAVIIGVTIFIVIQSLDDRPFGYVDYSGVLANATMPDTDEFNLEIIAFADKDLAMAALESEEIQGYHVIPKNYLETLFVDLYYLEESPDSSVLVDFDDFVRANLLEGPPTPIQYRIIDGATLTVKATNDAREFQDNETGIFVISSFADRRLPACRRVT